MHEVFPVVAGVIVALVVQRLSTPRQRSIALLVLSVLGGAIASLISGEVMVSWTYIVFDTTLVLLAAAAATALLVWWQGWTAQRR